MQQPRPTPTFRILTAILTGIAALALCTASASAQDPSVDQYTPTAPSGGGSVPTDADSTGIGGSGSKDDGGDGGSAATGGESGTAPSAPVAIPAVGDDSTESQAASGGSGDDRKSAEDRALEGLVANADAQRANNPGHDGGAATELLRTESDGGTGLGFLLWAVLGVTALWAIATVAKRRHDGSGHPA